MEFKIRHTNINVTDIERSLTFYREALGLEVVRRFSKEDGSFELVYLGDGTDGHQIELTWLRDHPQAYDLGENEWHIAFAADDKEAAYRLHKQMGCVCFENIDLGIYFIEDPDGYWLEIV